MENSYTNSKGLRRDHLAQLLCVTEQTLDHINTAVFAYTWVSEAERCQLVMDILTQHYSKINDLRKK